MGAHFSQMQDADREVLADQLVPLLQRCLGNLIEYDDRIEFGRRASFIIASVYSATGSETHYNDEALFTENPSLDAILGVIVLLGEGWKVLFDDDYIIDNIQYLILHRWMTILLNNILTDDDATPERVDDCRRILARRIVDEVCDEALLYEQMADELNANPYFDDIYDDGSYYDYDGSYYDYDDNEYLLHFPPRAQILQDGNELS